MNRPKLTLATLKAFAKRHQNSLYVKVVSEFDSSHDAVIYSNRGDFVPTKVEKQGGYYATGIQGVYTVGRGRDYFKWYEDEGFYGIEVYNCCGAAIVATKKSGNKS